MTKFINLNTIERPSKETPRKVLTFKVGEKEVPQEGDIFINMEDIAIAQTYVNTLRSFRQAMYDEDFATMCDMSLGIDFTLKCGIKLLVPIVEITVRYKENNPEVEEAKEKVNKILNDIME